MKVKVIWHGRSWSHRLDWHPGECNSGLGIDSAPPTSDIKPSGKPLINVKSVYFSLLEKRFEILRRYWLFKSAENRMLPGTGRVRDNPFALSEQSIWHWGHRWYLLDTAQNQHSGCEKADIPLHPEGAHEQKEVSKGRIFLKRKNK